ncbi:cell division cycle protein 20 homolog [Montipora foliosa]|uniref:cell division cycle protein 20 homolog n=1 Tax=Montipora foliosa TaxID=591990 RepID=UPI0035F12B02
MAQFEFEAGVNDCLKKLEAPLSRGPAPRWQRKEKQRSLSFTGKPFSPLQTTSRSRVPAKSKRFTSGQKSANTPKKTPRKSPKKIGLTPCGDRFIPNRPLTDCEWSHFQVMHGSEVNDTSCEMELEANQEYGAIIAENLGYNPANSKILRFKSGAPLTKEGHQNTLRVLYCQSKPTAPKAKSVRYIPQAEDRILDAPELLNDFYLNLVDWGSVNQIALALAGALYIWNPVTGETNHLIQMDGEDYISSVKWIQQGSIMAVGNSNGHVQLWDLNHCTCVRVMEGHAARVGSLAWNSYILSSGSRSGAIHHHDVRIASHHVGSLLSHTQEVCGLEWSPDGKLLASGGNDNVLNIWTQSRTEEPLHSVTDHQAAVKAVAWCPWQPSVLASGGGTADRHIRFWNGNTGSCLNNVDTSSQVSGLLWSKEYRELISGHGFSQNQLTIWKYPAMTRVTELTGHTSRILQMTLSPDGQYVASVAADETLRIWKCFATQQKIKKSSRQGTSKCGTNLMSCMKVR